MEREVVSGTSRSAAGIRSVANATSAVRFEIRPIDPKMGRLGAMAECGSVGKA